MSMQHRCALGAVVLLMAGAAAGDTIVETALLVPDPDDRRLLYGLSVDLDGDVAVVGNERDKLGTADEYGSACVFRRTGGSWAFEQKLTAASPENYGRFGGAVALSGDVIAVGEYGWDGSGGATFERGRVHVFRYDAGSSAWVLEQVIYSPLPYNEDWFGYEVDVEGDVLMVSGRRFASAGGHDRGNVVVHTYSGATWTPVQTIVGTVSTGQLGTSVDLNGDVVILGSGDGLGNDQAQIYRFDGATWQLEQALDVPDVNLPLCVSIDGDLAVVGQAGNDAAGSDSGAAFVYRRSGGTWSLEQTLASGDLSSGDRFGMAVRVREEQIVVGAPREAFGGLYAGAAYLFVDGGASWVQEHRIVATVLAPYSDFTDGVQTVALDGARAVIGAPGDNDPFAAVYDLAPVVEGVLALEADSCQVDADPEAGTQIAIELHMRDLALTTTGFHAYLAYDDAVLAYRGDLSAYTASPFPEHVQDVVTAEVTPGAIHLDGAVSDGDPGTTANALLATLVFDVLTDCATTTVAFDAGAPFDSELNYLGAPLATVLEDTGPFVLDDTPPDLDPCPDDIVQAADAGLGDGCTGAVVVYDEPTATDACSTPIVETDWPSGSVFPVGDTLVTWTATDDCGNVSMCSFTVTVTPTNLVDLAIELPGSLPGWRCLRVVAGDCAPLDELDLPFVDHDLDGGTPVRAEVTTEVDCGSSITLCLKDAQHTRWVTTTLSLSGDGTRWVTDPPASLVAGDTDDDSDVDIHDVTWLLYTFGGESVDGGCPWNGDRDADFDNDGAVGTTDFTLLSAAWLTWSICDCTSFQAPPPARTVRTRLAASEVAPWVAHRADLDRDGVIDFRDVARFERRHGLPDTLSTAMLLAEIEGRRR